MLKELQFNGEPVVVSGAGTGIGQACAEVLVELGATVVMIGRTERTLRETEALLEDAGGSYATWVGDVTDEAEVLRFKDMVSERWGHIKGLVNNAGNNFRSRITDLDTADWNRIIDVDLTSVYTMSKAFLPLLEKAPNGGAIVNNASIYGVVGNPLMPVYCAAKGGVLSLTRQLAVDYGDKGVRVNAICPGPTRSPRVQGYIDSGQSDESRLTSKILLKRVAECREVANVAVFLLSDAASFMHGESVVVDGGYTVH